MHIILSNHAKKRVRERGFIEEEIFFILRYQKKMIKSFLGRMIAYGNINNREIKVVFIKEVYSAVTYVTSAKKVCEMQNKHLQESDFLSCYVV
jgi:hypothetical protein